MAQPRKLALNFEDEDHTISLMEFKQVQTYQKKKRMRIYIRQYDFRKYRY